MKIYYIIISLVLSTVFGYAQTTDAEISTNTEVSKEIPIAKFEEMASEITEKLKDDPENIQLHEERAKIYLALKKYEKSIEDYTFLIKQNESIASYFYFRALNRLAINQIEGACQDFEKAKKLGYDLKGNQLWRVCDFN